MATVKNLWTLGYFTRVSWTTQTQLHKILFWKTVNYLILSSTNTIKVKFAQVLKTNAQDNGPRV